VCLVDYCQSFLGNIFKRSLNQLIGLPVNLLIARSVPSTFLVLKSLHFRSEEILQTQLFNPAEIYKQCLVSPVDISERMPGKGRVVRPANLELVDAIGLRRLLCLPYLDDFFDGSELTLVEALWQI